MDNKKKQIIELKTKKLVDSLFVWNYKTSFQWNGIEFAGFREYEEWDNVRNIDWQMSDKVWKTLVRLYEEERELSAYFIIDAQENFDFEFDGISKFSLLEEFLYMIWLSAIKAGDKIWLFIYNSEKTNFLLAKKGRVNFIHLINTVSEYITNKSQKPIFKLKKRFFSFWSTKRKFHGTQEKKHTLSAFNALHIKKSLVFLITSKDEIDDRELKILALKNDLVVCHLFHSFENTLYGNWIQWIKEVDIFLDKDDEKKKLEYQILRKEKIKKFRQRVLQLGWNYLYIDETSHIYTEIFKLMKQRI